MRATKGLTIIAIVLALAVPLAAAPAEALSFGCTESTAAEIFTPPLAVVLNFTPDCVLIQNGGTVTFTGFDAMSHRAYAPACLDSGNLLPGVSNTFSFWWDAHAQALHVKGVSTNVPEHNRNYPPSMGQNVTCSGEYLLPFVFPEVMVFGNHVQLSFQDRMAGPVMHGTIMITLPDA